MKKHSKIKKIVTLFSLMALLSTSLFTSAVSGEPYQYDLTAKDTVLDMGIGWNLGNTLEACGDWIDKSSLTNYETAWGNPVTTQAMLDGVKAAGFKSVRIPVAWSNLMASDYTINAGLLKRVKEVADYCSKNDMYVVMNIHWDNGWFEKFATEYDESMKKYTSVWTQLSNYFKDYPRNLIFESLNEEGCWNNVWNRWSGTTGSEKTRCFTMLNNINQKFVDIVRASGGYNTSRCLLIAGYGTDIDLTIDSLFKMPTDTAKNKLMISVHYYNPSTFTILEADADWGKSAFSWGTSSEINVVKTDLQKMKKFSDTGVPVIVGEYGSTTVNKVAASVRLYLQTVCQVAYDLGYCPMLWDPGTHFSRTDLRFKDSQLAPIFAKYKNLSRITLPTVTPEKTEAPINSVVGDANGDKTFNSIDFATVRLHLLGVSKLTGENLRAADVNGDGQVNSIDFALMRQYILGIITSFNTIT